MAGCKRSKLFCHLGGLWRKRWNTTMETGQIPSESKCYWVPFLAISLFEKLDPFLLEYMTYPNCQKRTSKIKLLSGLFLPAVRRGVMENLLTCSILAPSLCCLMSLYRDWIVALLVLRFFSDYLLAKVIEEVFLVVFHSIRIWVDIPHTHTFFVAFYSAERCAKHLPKQIRTCNTLQPDFNHCSSRSDIKYVLRE